MIEDILFFVFYGSAGTLSYMQEVDGRITMVLTSHLGAATFLAFFVHLMFGIYRRAKIQYGEIK